LNSINQRNERFVSDNFEKLYILFNILIFLSVFIFCIILIICLLINEYYGIIPLSFLVIILFLFYYFRFNYFIKELDINENKIILYFFKRDKTYDIIQISNIYYQKPMLLFNFKNGKKKKYFFSIMNSQKEFFSQIISDCVKKATSEQITSKKI